MMSNFTNIKKKSQTKLNEEQKTESKSRQSPYRKILDAAKSKLRKFIQKIP